MKKFLALLLCAFLLLPTAAAAADAPQSVSRSAADYSGAGSVIAIVGAGFYTEHPAFGEAPAQPQLYQTLVEETLADAYVSEKIPAAWDFADNDGDVSHTSFIGTAAASLAAGSFTGAGDTVHDDGSVTHESSFFGAAPDAQLLLFKAAPDTSVSLKPDAAAQAIEAALSLNADAIWLDTDGLTLTVRLLAALRKADAAHVPVLAGTGDLTDQKTGQSAPIPVTYTDRGTLSSFASWPAVVPVGAAAAPYAGISSFILSRTDEEDTEIQYSDSCEDYFGESFASLFGGQTLPLITVPGVGAAEDYAGLDLTGAVAVVMRGTITFGEKAQFAADAGAAAMIVVDNGAGLSRMALEDAPIPGVMVDAASGELLTAAEGASVSFRPGAFGAADFSASGISDDLSAAPVFLCAGQSVTAAIPPSQITSDAYYAKVSGTRFAAASAAGFVARAAEYCRACGVNSSAALAFAASTARAVTDEDGIARSVRDVGCGIVSDKGSYASFSVTAADTAPITLCGSLDYGSALIEVTITNASDARRRYSLSLSAFTEGFAAAEDGTLILDGTVRNCGAAGAYLRDSSVNLCDPDNAIAFTLSPGTSTTLTVQIIIPDSRTAELRSVFWNGFFVDGALTVTADTGEAVVHPYSVFCGQWESAPLADATVYEEGDPLFAPCRLLVRRFNNGGSGFALPLGTLNPYASDSPYSEEANLVNPALLSLGWVELELCALRNIDDITVTFYDSEHRTVCQRELGSAAKYTRGGTVSLPLWDFAAIDNPDYLFPDGEYACEVRLASSFYRNCDAVQYLGFFFTLDSEKPAVTSLSARREDDRVFLTVEAADDHAMLDVSVYDTVFTYAALEGTGTAFAGDPSVTMTFDITQFDALSPLYVEITDRAGNYSTVRISPETLQGMLGEE